MNRNPTYYQWLIPVMVLASVVLFDGCKHEPVQPATTSGTTAGTTSGTTAGTTSGTTSGTTGCDPNTIYFQTQVLPILSSNCAMSDCHDPGSAQDGIILTSYESVMGSDIIRRGEADDSDIIEVLLEDDEDKRMPLGRSPLSADQINIIRTWINQGAENIICSVATCDTSNVTFSGSVKHILDNKCKGCHQPGNMSGNINLSTQAGASAIALDNNRLWKAVSHQGPNPMPQNLPKLPDCDLAKIRIWIEAGAPNN